MSQSGIPARRTAAFLLDRVIGDGKLMSELVASGALDRLDAPDKARAQRLAMTVLRNLERADRLIGKHVPKPPPLPIRNLLRLGVIELRDGSGAHGVVNDLVSIAARNKQHGRLKGLVNAVLRKLAVDVSKEWDILRTPQMPGWLRAPLKAAWGPEALKGIEAAHHAGAPLDLTPRGDAAVVAKALDAELLPTGSVRVRDAGQVSKLPGYRTGDWWVQDAAAAIPARFARGPKVLDLCTAPGSKALQLAAAGCEVTAIDSSAKRLELVEENLTRTGLRADVQHRDVREMKGQWDTVLLDAPCSATGTIRRHPDLPHAKDGSDFIGLFALQAELLDHAIGCVKPGGRLIYCTCSLLPDEGEVQVEEALTRHKDLRVDRAALDAPWLEPAWITKEGGLRLRPDYWADRGGMDGFYIAVLTR